MLGKALEDPIAGLNAMKRVGVSFTADEREMIQAMVHVNDVAGAQGKILEVLHNQVGGAAGAEAGGLLGSIDTLNYRMREFTERLEETNTYKGCVDALAESFRNLTWTVKDLRDAFTLDDELAQLEAAIKNKENLISEIETEGMDFLGFKGRALEGHREELSEMQRQLAELEAQIEKRNREEQKHIKTSTPSDSSGGAPDPAAVAKTASSLAQLNTEIARMTMTDRKFDEFQLERRVERFGKVLGKTNPKLREFRRLAQKRIDAKYAPKQPAPGMDDHPFSARKDAENAAFAEALARQKMELAAFDREYTRVTQGETVLAEEAARALAEARERAGAERVKVEEWLAARIKQIREESGTKDGSGEHLSDLDKMLAGAKTGFASYAEGIKGQSEMTEKAVGNGMRGLEDQLVNLTTTGKASWSDMVHSWAADLSRMLIQQQITGPLAAYMGGSSASAAGGMVAMIASLFHSGGVVGEGGMSRGVSPAAFVGAPRYHSGGIAGLAPDEVPAILRRREEVLTEDDPRHRDNLRPASTEPPQVNVRVVNVVDEKDTAAGYLGSAEGERTVMNIIRKNRQTLREIV
jgi:hypothetical protein